MAQRRKKQKPVDVPAPTYTVRLRSADGELATLRVDDKTLYSKGFYWRYVDTNPQRLTAQRQQELLEKSVQEMTQLVEQSVVGPGPGDSGVLERVAAAEVVEVSIPYETEATGWGARTFPWESVLSVATKRIRGDRNLIVVRHLDIDPSRDVSDRNGPPAPPSGLLTVRSAPGSLAQVVSQGDECRLVDEALGTQLSGGLSRTLEDPRVEDLRQEVQQTNPSVIHLAAVASQTFAMHAQQMGIELGEEPNRDGCVFRGREQPFQTLEAEPLAAALTAGNPRPTLVSFSTCYSAARLAPMAIVSGVRSAVGFSDISDAGTRALLFPQLYSAWYSSNWNLLEAFQAAIRWLGQQPLAQMRGGIVLWSDRSLVIPSPQLETREHARRGTAVRDGGRRAPPAATSELMRAGRASQAVNYSIHVQPRRTLNYSLLHNAHLDTSLPQLRTPYFQTFLVHRFRLEDNEPLDVEARLNVGEGECHCRFRAEWPEDTFLMDLRPRVALPLVTSLQRQSYECLNTTWEIAVRCDGRLLFHETHPVRLLPADEWRDDDSLEENRAWLASFTMPRDPAVLRVIQAAQRYLRTLLDDAGAGFDGYQRINEDPVFAGQVVDPQVRSLWAAMLHDLPLAYINPPPTYSEASQRLRTPRMILEGGSATCIDLALLLASCLEFVGISPVIFLIQGHAFPGYWRSDLWCDELQHFGALDAGKIPFKAVDSGDSRTTTRQQFPWMYDRDKFNEIRTYVLQDKLVPLESTLVTQRQSFARALDVGRSLLQADTFDAMVDIQIARKHRVTPLPL